MGPAVVPNVGTWIEIGTWSISGSIEISRSLRGNVDRNLCFVQRILILHVVVPYVGTWIEILARKILDGKIKSFPTWERG